MINKVNLDGKFALFTERWTPKIVAELNGQLVKLAKLKGEFTWHSHAQEDEFFYVHKGEFTLRLRDREVFLQAGEFFVVPAGVEHSPLAEEEAQVVLFEPKGTAHTGTVESEMTVTDQEWI